MKNTRKEEGMKKFGSVKGVIILIIMIVLVGGYYYYLSNRNVPESEEIVPQSEKLTMSQTALARNLETNYPPTPREVVKYFSEITQCFYNEEHTEEELDALGLKIRELYDEELIANQSQENYLASLRYDIEEYKQKSRTISSYAPSSSVDVETFSQNGFDWARLYCIYGIKQGELLYNSNTVFVLRKDSEGHYKIYGWKLVEE